MAIELTIDCKHVIENKHNPIIRYITNHPSVQSERLLYVLDTSNNKIVQKTPTMKGYWKIDPNNNNLIYILTKQGFGRYNANDGKFEKLLTFCYDIIPPDEEIIVIDRTDDLLSHSIIRIKFLCKESLRSETKFKVVANLIMDKEQKLIATFYENVEMVQGRYLITRDGWDFINAVYDIKNNKKYVLQVDDCKNFIILNETNFFVECTSGCKIVNMESQKIILTK
ncbi:MAG: hypothetical protein Edafosvirus3_75 [Edafosvirus sp.]|uniref:Uncharacterized protein n=1 Tax=Edafosvirus sp. TaxID=2487765 RepID=A0A3G4ZSZ1_9VIRU|nr:MAG: hypothetical protein Edafosvirus3_75 [Edafosvirus sp.]